MTPAATDVHRTLNYGTGRRDMLGLGLGLVVLMLGLYFQVVASSKSGNPAWLAMAAGTIVVVWAVARIVNPKPRLALSDRGVFFRVQWIKDVFIPWREVLAIETLDIPGPKGHVFKDVTVLTISKKFYDRHVHTDAWMKRLTPFWDLTFRLVDRQVQAALHHYEIGVPPQVLRAEAEARWRAFGKPPARAAADTTSGHD